MLLQSKTIINQKRNQGEKMWKCPNCNTKNEYEFCGQCGQPRPVVDESEKMIRNNDRVVKILIIVIAVLASIMILLLCVLPMLSSIQKPGETEVPPVSRKEETVKESESDKEAEEGARILGISARKHSGRVDEIIIEMTDFIEPEMSTLSDPARVVLDFKECKLWNKAESCDISGYNFKNIRKGDHNTYSRVVIDISESCSINTKVTDNECVVTLTPKD